MQMTETIFTPSGPVRAFIRTHRTRAGFKASLCILGKTPRAVTATHRSEVEAYNVASRMLLNHRANLLAFLIEESRATRAD